MNDHKPMTPPPALGVCRQHRLTNRRIAQELRLSEGWVCRVLLGHVKPPASFRTGLAAMLGCTEDALFLESADSDPAAGVA